MGEQTVVVISPDELAACNKALDLINTKTLELGLLKRGHKHLWNELARKYGVDKKAQIILDYKTGVMTAEDPAAKKTKKAGLKLVPASPKRSTGKVKDNG